MTSMTTSPAEAPADLGDRVLRAITDDDNFRVITARTTDTVRDAIAAQKATGATRRHFANLLTGAVLIRETMSPGHRVQGILQGRAGSLVADSHPDGVTRGLVQFAEGEDELLLGPGSLLQMMRIMAHGRVHRSVVEPPAGGGVAEALMTYMQESEQIVSMIATGVTFDGDDVVEAGGYVVQLLPGVGRGPLMIMTERLEGLPAIDDLLIQLKGSAEALLRELLFGMDHCQLDTSPVRFGCRCSREAVVASLATLERDELSEMLAEDGVLELDCDYCGTIYRIGRTHLEGLLESS